MSGGDPNRDSVALVFDEVSKKYGEHWALDDVSFRLGANQIVGLVGESGSGKSTCVRIALALERPTKGRLLLGREPYPVSRRRLRSLRQSIGFVFQDPYDSLDPRMSIGESIAEPLRCNRWSGRQAKERVHELLPAVGLADAPFESYPARYSGGERQRIAVARGLALRPRVLLCDEPTASLDVSVQAQIVNLLLEVKQAEHLSVLFVSHNIDLVSRIADEVVVMYRGRLLELGRTDDLVSRPRHPYTVSLMADTPTDDPRRPRVVHNVARATEDESEASRLGCVFAHRCPRVRDRCHNERPRLAGVGGGSLAACFFPHGTRSTASGP